MSRMARLYLLSPDCPLKPARLLSDGLWKPKEASPVTNVTFDGESGLFPFHDASFLKIRHHPRKLDPGPAFIIHDVAGLRRDNIEKALKVQVLNYGQGVILSPR